MLKGFASGIGEMIGKGYNKLETNFLDAKDNSLFFGSRGQRQRLVHGKDEVRRATDDVTNARRTRKETVQGINDLEASLSGTSMGADAAAAGVVGRKAANTAYSTARNAGAKRGVLGVGDMGRAAGSWVAGADRAGQGWSRTAAVGTRAGAVVGTGMALGVGGRYATGGSYTKNRNGERDIAGIPFV